MGRIAPGLAKWRREACLPQAGRRYIELAHYVPVPVHSPASLKGSRPPSDAARGAFAHQIFLPGVLIQCGVGTQENETMMSVEAL